MTPVVVLVVVLVAATAFGLWRRMTDGRFRGESQPLPPELIGDVPLGEQDAVDGHPGDVLTAADLGAALGSRATLVQFSSAFCAPCRTARVTLGRVAADLDGVAHVEVDAESHLDLVRRVDVRRTPTTLVLDAAGREVRRAVGAPRYADVVASLDGVV